MNDNISLTISLPAECADTEALAWILDKWGELFKKALLCQRTDFYIAEQDGETAITFPWWEQETANARRASYYALFLQKLCDWSKQKLKAIYAPKGNNDLYEFRSLLLTLGYVGDEWKCERQILCEELVAVRERQRKRK